MSSTKSTATPLFAIGPIQVISTSVIRRLLGAIIAFIGYDMIAGAANPIQPPSSTITWAAIGGFILFNGLYLNGVRFQ